MQLLEDVYTNYPATRASGRCLPSTPFTPDRAALRDGLPAFLMRLLAGTNRDLTDFKIYGRAGEMNRNFPKVPWVAVCNRSITTSTRRGYYVVLLFHEKMSGCFLSLNQGYTQFAEAFPTGELALVQIEQSAHHCLNFLEPRPSSIAGPIDLGATGDLGTGYERGAILSEWYARSTDVGEDRFAADLAYLLDQYDRLIDLIGHDLTVKLPPIAEGAFQEAVSSLAKSDQEWHDPPPGPVPVPPLVPGSSSLRRPRKPRVSARAQQLAGFRCEADASHLTFISQASKQNFVESHHLVPMGLQGEVEANLDVAENVVALCPNCHRLLHHGRRGQKRPMLLRLFQRREGALRSRGIPITFNRLLTAYAKKLPDED